MAKVSKFSIVFFNIKTGRAEGERDNMINDKPVQKCQQFYLMLYLNINKIIW